MTASKPERRRAEPPALHPARRRADPVAARRLAGCLRRRRQPDVRVVVRAAGAADASARSYGIADRSITINVVNAIPSTTLAATRRARAARCRRRRKRRSPPASTAVSVEQLGRLHGIVQPAGGGASFAISYTHPFGSQPTTVSVTPSAGYVSVPTPPRFGHDSVANLTLYRGVPTANGAWSSRSRSSRRRRPTTADFANSMFGSNVRTAAPSSPRAHRPARLRAARRLHRRPAGGLRRAMGALAERRGSWRAARCRCATRRRAETVRIRRVERRPADDVGAADRVAGRLRIRRCSR